jgi:hypothetical protein
MTKEGLVTEKDAIRSMLIETQNNLTQSTVTDKLYRRLEVGGLDQQSLLKMGGNQKAMVMAEKMVRNLKELLKDASDVKPLADIFPEV